MKKLVLMATILVVASTCVVSAQERQPTLKPTLSPKGPPIKAKLLLEVAYNRALPPAYVVVNGADEKPKWMWLTMFALIPGREAPKPPVQAVRLEPVYNGETADVRVSLFRGREGFEQEDLVGVYQVGMGEQKIISDLDQFGIEPFTLTLLNTLTPLPPPPTFDNRIKSIEVVDVQLENSPSPGYRVIFRNLSDKNVGALKLEVVSDGKRSLSALWQGEHGRSVIKAGAIGEKFIPVMKSVKTPTGYAPGAPSATTIIIASAVFEDFSFEGDSAPACSFKSYQMGRKLWLKQVIPLFEQELSKVNADHIEAARQFKDKLSAFKYVTEAGEPEMPSSAAECAKPSQSLAIAVEGMKLELLRELDQIVTTRPLPPINFKTWMEEKRALFAVWLARL